MFKLIKADLFKISRKRLSWGLLLILLAYMTYFSISGYVEGYGYDDNVLPTAMESKFSYMSIISLLIIILSAFTIGTEYKKGTLQETLAGGISRTQYLCSKYIALVTTTLCYIIITTILSFIISLITTMLRTGSISWNALSFSYIGYIITAIGLIYYLYICIYMHSCTLNNSV
jgi:ABC-type transport system involved in multi-copper enzyme maturation permease subunit